LPLPWYPEPRVGRSYAPVMVHGRNRPFDSPPLKRWGVEAGPVKCPCETARPPGRTGCPGLRTRILGTNPQTSGLMVAFEGSAPPLSVLGSMVRETALRNLAVGRGTRSRCLRPRVFGFEVTGFGACSAGLRTGCERVGPIHRHIRALPSLALAKKGSRGHTSAAGPGRRCHAISPQGSNRCRYTSCFGGKSTRIPGG
jgi:hypothetical protein